MDLNPKSTRSKYLAAQSQNVAALLADNQLEIELLKRLTDELTVRLTASSINTVTDAKHKTLLNGIVSGILTDIDNTIAAHNTTLITATSNIKNLPESAARNRALDYVHIQQVLMNSLARMLQPVTRMGINGPSDVQGHYLAAIADLLAEMSANSKKYLT